MSLVCHTIVSRYTPQQRDPITVVDEDEDPWQTESSFGPTQRLHSRPVPSFVPAAMEYDEWGMPKTVKEVKFQSDKSCDSLRDVSVWYRNLTSRGSVKLEEQPSTAGPSSTTSVSQSSSLPHVHARDPHVLRPAGQKRNWFTSCSSHETTPHISKPSTLGDLLSRNPPPLPSEPTFTPPVFLTIGPSNKGFTMLQRQGWQEGEGLGNARVGSKSKAGFGFSKTLEAAFRERSAEQCKPISRPAKAHAMPLGDVKHEVLDLTLSDLESKQDTVQEVIDLTLSDSDQDYEDVGDSPQDTSSQSTPHGTTLLTPIATTLKADRLGIGLKAARRSQNVRAKAITHTSAALAAHIRSAHKARVEKARHGRGSRGSARAKRNEERERVDLLAYMKS